MRTNQTAYVPACLIALFVMWFIAADTLHAHEVDNYSVPFCQEYADIGPLLDAIAYRNMQRAVDDLNAKIRTAQQHNLTAEQLEQFQSPYAIATAVRYAFPPTLSMIDDIERMLASPQVRMRYPGLVTAYKPFSCIYDHASFVLDPRQVFKLWRASTVRIGDTYLGTDKIGHFLSKGYINFDLVTRELAKHGDRERAMAAALSLGTSDHFFYSEKRMVGYFSSGVFCHADLTADYAGLLFYINLTEPVTINGETRPAMLRLNDQGLWEFAPHIRPDSKVLSSFVSHHFDEVLNPNLFEPTMRNAVRRAIEERSCRLLEWYADELGNRRPRAWFESLIEEHTTYYGVEYGHDRRWNDMVTILNTCLAPFDFGDDIQARSPRGWTALHDAAATGDTARLQQLLEQGAELDAPVQSRETWSSQWGDTPLHIAATEQQLETAVRLIEAGANVNAANIHGVRPLHRAARQPQLMQILLERGAEVDAADQRGRTALHWAAAYNQPQTLALLIDRGAKLDAVDHRGQTPLHYAATFAGTEALTLLIERGAKVNHAADLGATPLHVAVRRNNIAVVERLIKAKADVHAADEFGCTPLHDAAARHHGDVAALLLTAGAHAAARDAFNDTPLHHAARHGHQRIVELLLQHNASVTDRNDAQRTALHEAAAHGHRAVMTLLEQHGADVTSRDRRGKTPADLAAAAPLDPVEQFGRLGQYR